MSLAERHSDNQPRFAYGDYVQWTGDERWELIDGIAYQMSPAPTSAHQLILMELLGQLYRQLEGHRCRVVPAPFDVRLPESDEADEDVKTVVQPDIAVICDADKIDAKGGRGAPDFVIEILSPSTAARDRAQKNDLYEKHGVREYWIVDPLSRSVEARILGKDRRWQGVRRLSPSEAAPIAALPGLKIDLAKVFAAAVI